MVLNPQRQVDVLEQETKVTQTIDNYNIIQSPYTVNVWNYKDPTTNETCNYEYTHWILNKTSNSISGLHGVQTDLIHVTFPAIKPLEHKLITRIEIVTDIVIESDEDLNENTYPILNSVGIGYKDSYNTVQLDNGKELGWKYNENTGEYKPIPITSDKIHITFSNNENNLIWGYTQDNLDKLLQSGKFSIEFNVDISNSTHTITFKNTYLRVYFTNYFQSESEAVENRLQSLGYNLTGRDTEYSLYIDEDGYLWEESNSMNAPVFTLEDGVLYVEGDNLPSYDYNSTTGELSCGYSEDCTLYLAVTNQTRNNTNRINDNLLITTAILDTNSNRVINQPVTIKIAKYNQSTEEYDDLTEYSTIVTTTNDGYAYYNLSLDLIGKYLISVQHIQDNYYNNATNSTSITVEA